MKKYDCVVFDVDGTLLDTTEGVLCAVQYTIDHFEFQALPESVLKTFIGPPIQNSFANAYHLEGDILQEIATVFRNRYKDVDLLKAVPYEGIYDVFDALCRNGIKSSIATYKRQDYAETILRHFHFDRYTDVLRGADHENKLKKKDIIEKSLRDCGITDYRKAVMVGDSSHDAIGAAEIGLDFIGVTYGFEFRTMADVMKYPAIGVAATPLEILNYII